MTTTLCGYEWKTDSARHFCTFVVGHAGQHYCDKTDATYEHGPLAGPIQFERGVSPKGLQRIGGYSSSDAIDTENPPKAGNCAVCKLKRHELCVGDGIAKVGMGFVKCPNAGIREALTLAAKKEAFLDAEDPWRSA